MLIISMAELEGHLTSAIMITDMALIHSMNLSAIGETELYAAVIDLIGAALPSGDRTQEGYTLDFKQEWSEKVFA